MHRRKLLKAALWLPLAWAAPGFSPALAGPGAAAEPFDDDTVARLARALAAAPFAPPSRDLPAWLAAADYDRWRDIRFSPAESLWRGDGRGFELQFFHRGSVHRERVRIDQVVDGQALPVPYRAAQFDFGRSAGEAASAGDIGFAGFRAHAAINTSDYLDEVCAFLGASYFRAVARGQAYGLSARGLALGTGDPAGEEFPRFTRFWIERPRPGADALVIHALLDSASVAGAYRFVVHPGEETRMEVDARLYPRVALDSVGIAPLTSMYYFDAVDRAGIDDYRDAVHDSDGLALLGRDGSVAWRPLQNPPTLQESTFDDVRGFGLMQRKRRYADYGDSEARYHQRPSLWVEPGKGWGDGRVHLFEIPTADEYQDNIVAFWRPRRALRAGREHRFGYRLHWGVAHPWRPELARVVRTRAGAVPGGSGREFVLDLEGDALARLDPATARLDVSAAAGTISSAVLHSNPEAGGWRAAFLLEPGNANVSELQARVLDGAGNPLSETWLYRWLR